jgi:hypothetical protein
MDRHHSARALDGLRIMRTVKIILWLQILVGLVGGYIAFAYVHWGAMSQAWAYNLRVEFDRMKQSAGYQEPPRIRDQPWDKILEDMQAYGLARDHVAGYWALACAALVVFAAAVLWLLPRTGRSTPALQATAAPPFS